MSETVEQRPLERPVMHKTFVAVLAGNFQEFSIYKDNDALKYIYCNNWPDFAGIEFHRFIEVGTFRKRPDALQLYQRVLPMVRADGA